MRGSAVYGFEAYDLLLSGPLLAVSWIQPFFEMGRTCCPARVDAPKIHLFLASQRWRF